MELSLKELKEIYMTKTILETCTIFKISVPTLYKLLDEHKVPRKGNCGALKKIRIIN